MGGLVWGWMWVCQGVPHAHTHACTHMHASTYIHVKHVKHGCLHVSSHLKFLYMCVHACVCMYVHVHVCGDTPMPPDVPHPSAPSPRAAGSPKHQNSNIQSSIQIFKQNRIILISTGLLGEVSIADHWCQVAIPHLLFYCQ